MLNKQTSDTTPVVVQPRLLVEALDRVDIPLHSFRGKLDGRKSKPANKLPQHVEPGPDRSLTNLPLGSFGVFNRLGQSCGIPLTEKTVEIQESLES